MRDGPLLRLLRILDKSETSKLKRQLKKCDPRLYALLSAMVKAAPGYLPDKLDEEKLFAALYPTESFNAHKLNRHKVDLKKEIEQFLVKLELEADMPLFQLLLARQLKNRLPEDAYEDAYHGFQQEIRSQRYGWIYHRLNFEAQMDRLDSGLTSKSESNLEPSIAIRDSLRINTITWKYYLEIDRLSRSKHLNENLPEFDIDAAEKELKSTDLEAEPLLWILKLIHELYLDTKKLNEKVRKKKRLASNAASKQSLDIELDKAYNKNKDKFIRVFRALKNHVRKFPPKEQIELVRYILNHCISMYNSGNHNYILEQLEIYRWGDQEGIFIVDGHIDHSFLMNVVITAAVVGDLNFAQVFLDKNEEFIIPLYRPDTVNFSQAYIHFHVGKYKKAVEALDKIHATEHSLFANRRQSLLLRAIYCLYRDGKLDPDDVDNRCKAFINFFKRNTYSASDNRIDAYLKLEYFVRKMLWYDLHVKPKPQHFLLKLEKELDDAMCIAKQWVKAEIAKL